MLYFLSTVRVYVYAFKTRRENAALRVRVHVKYKYYYHILPVLEPGASRTPETGGVHSSNNERPTGPTDKQLAMQ